MATPPYAIDLNFWERLSPKVSQWELTHGRPLPKSKYQALVEAELGNATKLAEQRYERGRALDLEQRRLELAEEAAKGSKIKGAVDIASTVGTGYLTYKTIGVMEKQAETLDAIAKSRFGVGGGAPGGSAFAPNITGVPGAPPATAAETAAFLGGTAPHTGVPLASAVNAPSVVSGPAAIDLGAGGQVALQQTSPLLSPAAAPATATVAAEAGGTAIPAGASTPLATAGWTAAAGAAGYAAGYLASKAFGANEDISQALQLGGAGAAIGGYLAAGTAMGGPVGALIGLGIGATVSLVDDSVVCGELRRQGLLSESDYRACLVFRKKYINDVMYVAYLERATPHVRAMQRGGIGNLIRLPFAKAFVGYMVKTARGKTPSRFERAFFNYAWRVGERDIGTWGIQQEVLCHG